jgi:hypothetical protein
METMLKSNNFTPNDYRANAADLRTVKPAGDPNSLDHRYDAGAIGWGVGQEKCVQDALKIRSCKKHVLREWDRFNSDVYVYTPGKQPNDLNKKYQVDMHLYKL